MAAKGDVPQWVREHRWDVGRRLRELRAGRGLTQMQLAELCGIDNKTISRAENGRYAISIDQAVRLSRALGVPSWRLFRD